MVCTLYVDSCLMEIRNKYAYTISDAYIQEFWIEYSDDLCSWQSHPMRNIKCHYIAGRRQQSMDDNYDDDGGQIMRDTTVLPDYSSTGNPTEYHMATIKLWPVINAQFIRIRPWKWSQHIALRIELYGNDKPSDSPQIGKLVTMDTVEPKYKVEVAEKLKNKDINTKVIQIDCLSIIKKAMDRGGCNSYGIIDTHDGRYLLTFSTPNAATSESM